MNNIFYISIFFYFILFYIFYTVIGYSLFLRFLVIFIKKKESQNYSFTNLPNVTILVVAHNEEKVILNKLNNLIRSSYPKNKLKILVSSDNSSDDTNKIVEDFATNNSDFSITLHKVRERKGKTNAQNEAVRLIDTELIVFTDANSIFNEDSIYKLVSSFKSKDISYVCGKLIYTNSDLNNTAKLEDRYWSIEMETRKIESYIQTIITGNGAIYAVRKSDYIFINPMESHDSSFPYIYGLMNKKSIFNEDAIAFEKAGETLKDEFKRKVRMKRLAFTNSFLKLEALNFLKLRWFTFFYLGHRYSRDILWFNHLILFFINFFLAFHSEFYLILLFIHIFIYIFSLLSLIFELNIRFINIINYYVINVIAQYIGVYKEIFGLNKPFWDKAESTR